MAAPANNGTNNPQTVTGGDAGSVIIGPTKFKTDALFECNVFIEGTLTVTDVQTDYDSLHVTGNVDVQTNLLVHGTTALTETVTTNQNLIVGTTANVNGALNALGGAYVTGGIQSLSVGISSLNGGAISTDTGDITSGGALSAGTTLGVTGESTLTGNVTAQDSVNVINSVNATTFTATADISAGTTITATGVIKASNFSGNTRGTNTGDQTITLTGDVTGSGTGSFATTLASSGVVAGVYGSGTLHTQVTVDSKGRVTSAANVALGAIAPTSIATGNVSVTGNVTVNGGLNMPQATTTSANGFYCGSATLVSGTITITCSNVKSTSLIFVSHADTVGSGTLRIGAITPGTSFVVSSSTGGDTSKFNWLMINPS